MRSASVRPRSSRTGVRQPNGQLRPFGCDSALLRADPPFRRPQFGKPAKTLDKRPIFLLRPPKLEWSLVMHALNYDNFGSFYHGDRLWLSSETRQTKPTTQVSWKWTRAVLLIGPDGGISPDATISEAQCEETWEIADSITLSCGSDSMTFDPLLLIDGQWQSPTNCNSMESDVLSCTFESAGTLVLRRSNQTLIPTFEVSRSLTLGGFRLKGQGQIEGVENWLSNGYQSWSQSGQISLSDPVDEETVLARLEFRATSNWCEQVNIFHGGRVMSMHPRLSLWVRPQRSSSKHGCR